MLTIRQQKALEAYLKKMVCSPCNGIGRIKNGRICHACNGSGSSELFRRKHQASTYGLRHGK